MSDRKTLRPGAELPKPAPPPSPEELKAREDFKSTSGCAAGIVIVPVLITVSIGSEAVPFLILALIIGALAVFTWYQLPQGKLEQHQKQVKLLEEAAGRDYVTVDMLIGRDQPLLRRVQSSVDAIMESPLHREGRLVDTTRDTVVLRDLEWQIAADLYKASQAEKELLEVGAPGSDQKQANQAYQRALGAIRLLRDEAEGRVKVIQGYAARVRKAQRLLADMERVGDYDRIADGLLAESAGGRQQDEALDSLEDAKRDAEHIARLHQDLGL